MSISPEAIRVVAAEVAREHYANLEVVGVRADGEYAEIHLVKDGCQIEPCRVTVGVFRDTEPEALRQAIEDALRRHVTPETR